MNDLKKYKLLDGGMQLDRTALSSVLQQQKQQQRILEDEMEEVLVQAEQPRTLESSNIEAIMEKAMEEKGGMLIMVVPDLEMMSSILSVTHWEPVDEQEVLNSSGVAVQQLLF